MPKQKNEKTSASRHSMLVRIVALVMTGLVASGAVVYLIMLLMNLFGG